MTGASVPRSSPKLPVCKAASMQELLLLICDDEAACTHTWRDTDMQSPLTGHAASWRSSAPESLQPYSPGAGWQLCSL